MSTSTRRRVARKPRRCDSCERNQIERGHVYLEHTAFPGYGDEAGYATAAGHPVRMAECADCAIRYGRDFELDPVPVDQPYRYWLGDIRPREIDPLGLTA